MRLFGRPAGDARPTGSLFVQLITLTGLTLALAEIISLLLIFNLPPTPPDFYRLTEIEQQFRGIGQGWARVT